MKKKLTNSPLSRRILAFNCKHFSTGRCKCTNSDAHNYAPRSHIIEPDFHTCPYISHPNWKGSCDHWKETIEGDHL